MNQRRLLLLAAGSKLISAEILKYSEFILSISLIRFGQKISSNFYWVKLHINWIVVDFEIFHI